jgi:hypothetical protein
LEAFQQLFSWLDPTADRRRFRTGEIRLHQISARQDGDNRWRTAESIESDVLLANPAANKNRVAGHHRISGVLDRQPRRAQRQKSAEGTSGRI